MICPTCYGDGQTRAGFPCEECGGCGTAHCCEGMQEQPWPEPEGGFGAVHDPLARALRNSPLYACPDLDSVITDADRERAQMEWRARWLRALDLPI